MNPWPQRVRTQLDAWEAAFRKAMVANPRTVAGALAAVLLAAVVSLLAPDSPQSVQFLLPEQINTVSPADIRATHSFEVQRTTDAELARVRADATAAVRPVWDHKPDLTARVVAAVEDVFGSHRARLRIEATNRIALLPSRLQEGSGASVAGTDTTQFQEDFTRESSLQILSPADRLAVVMGADALHDLLRAESRLSDESLAILAADAFSVEAEDALKQIVQSVMGRYLVADRSLIEQIEPDGILLRTVGSEGTQERQVRNFRDWFALPETMDLAYAAAARFPNLEAPLRAAIAELASVAVVVNTQLNHTDTAARTQEAGDAAVERFRNERKVVYRPGEIIVQDGEVITADLFNAVDLMQRTAPATTTTLRPIVGLIVLVVLVLALTLRFAQQHLRAVQLRTKDLAMMATVLVIHLGATRLGVFLAEGVTATAGGEGALASLLLIPFAFGTMMVRVLTRADNAIVYAIVYALLAGVLLDFDALFVLVAIVGSLAGGLSAGEAESRADLLGGAVRVGLATAVLTAGMLLVRGGWDSFQIFRLALYGLLGAVPTALMLLGLLPVFEYLFRYTTHLRLLELANLNHPLLRDLILKAPGSYHHSMMVGQLVEAACEAVGADALLGRVGSYFHDIGKMKSPQYFAENQGGDNPHNRISPHMSALVIKAHVRDGVEMARVAGLPVEIVDFIREHHGTMLIRYFHHKATESGEAVNDSDFRYPGPRPQSRETAICLLADGIEAASRAMPEPTPSRLKGLIQRMVNQAFTDGQLDQCNLTLKDLHAIANAFHGRLTAFYHHRPEYPEARRTSPTTQPHARITPPAGSPPPPPVSDDRTVPERDVATDGRSDDDVASGPHRIDLPRLGDG